MTWLPRSLSSKLSILLIAFLTLQAIQLGIGIIGVRQVGERAVFINEVGKQRMRTLLLEHLAHRAMQPGTDTRVFQHQLLTEIARYDATLADFSERAYRTGNSNYLNELITEARSAWEQDLRPLLLNIGPERSEEARNTIRIYSTLAVDQVDRIDHIVQKMEKDTRSHARDLTILNIALLGASLTLVMLAVVVARRKITRPLHTLVTASQAIAAGAYEQRVHITTEDELRTLGENFNRMAEAVAANTTRLKAVNKIAVDLTSSLGLDESLDRIMLEGMTLTGAQAASIAFYDEDSGGLANRVTQNLSEDYIKRLNTTVDGVAEAAFACDSYILVSDRPDTKYKLDAVDRKEGIRVLICLPFVYWKRRVGVAYFYRRDRDTFLPEEIGLLDTFSHLAAGAIDNARLYAETMELATTDFLTGLANRRVFLERLQIEVQRSRRYGSSLVVMLLDVDRFKQLNDTHGHLAGDLVLRQLADIFRKQTRDVDLVARFGGEEFMFLFPELDGSSSKQVAERIRKAVAGACFSLPDGKTLAVTASIGAVCFPRSAENADRLIEHADQALYVAKREGRNRVCLYREMLRTELEKTPDRIADLLRESLENVEHIVTAVNVRAGFLRSHSEEVERYGTLIGRALSLQAEELETLRLTGLLHDVGMITIPETILNKREPLTSEERQVFQQHSVDGADILGRVPALRDVALIVRHHHERYDGGGYPDGLKGEEIPILARILAVADAFTMMTEEWPGSTPKNMETARAEIRAGIGKQFDPEIAETLLRILEDKAAR